MFDKFSIKIIAVSALSGLIFIILPLCFAYADTQPTVEQLKTPPAAAGCQSTKDVMCLNVPIGAVSKVNVSGNGLHDYFNAWYKFLTGAVGIMATIMIMYGGFKWLTSRGGGDVGQAKDIIFSALLGLVLALLSWVILNTINPQLLVISLPGPELLQPISGGGAYNPSAMTISINNGQVTTAQSSNPTGSQSNTGQAAPAATTPAANPPTNPQTQQTPQTATPNPTIQPDERQQFINNAAPGFNELLTIGEAPADQRQALTDAYNDQLGKFYDNVVTQHPDAMVVTPDAVQAALNEYGVDNFVELNQLSEDARLEFTHKLADYSGIGDLYTDQNSQLQFNVSMQTINISGDSSKPSQYDGQAEIYYFTPTAQ